MTRWWVVAVVAMAVSLVFGASHRTSRPATARAAAEAPRSDDEFLTMVQRATFAYFFEGAHPASGMARDRFPFDDRCASGGTGMGLMAMPVGVERGFVSREQAAALTVKVLRFLDGKCERFHGAWAHWIDGRTGRSLDDSGAISGDLVETAYVIQGALVAAAYFDRDDSTEREICRLADKLYREVEWDWFLRQPAHDQLSWGWSPDRGWDVYGGPEHNHVRGFDETMIVYLLAIGSPAHAVPYEHYLRGWIDAGGGDDAGSYSSERSFYGHRQYVTCWRHPENAGMPLFFTHYSFLGFDPRGVHDGVLPAGVTYDEVFRNITLIDRAYCMENPRGHRGYGATAWGLTASDDPGGYEAHCPMNDNGTLTPSAGISAIVYTPRESLELMRALYAEHGKRLWGPYGFKDAFHPGKHWYADSYLAIDQGPIVIMIENHRTQLVWRLFMSHPDVRRLVGILRSNGWTIEDRALR